MQTNFIVPKVQKSNFGLVIDPIVPLSGAYCKLNKVVKYYL